MDLRNIKKDKAVMLIETRTCRPLPLAIFLVVIFLVTILGAALTALIPDQYIFDETKATVRIFDGPPYPNYTLPSSSTGLSYNKILFARPVSSNEHIGINFDLDLNVTKVSSTKTQTIKGHFNCLPNEDCTDVLLLRYEGKQTAVTISVANTTQAHAANNWLGDLKLVTRYDNMNFERVTIIWRYISIALVLVVFLMLLIQTCRMNKKLTAEQQDVILLMIGVLIYNNPAYVFILFYRGSFWSIIDEILSMFGVCTMMLYPIIVLGGFITTRLTFCSFYLPRLCITVLYFLSRLLVEIYPTIQSRLDPDTDVYSLPVYRAFNTISSVVYAIWVVFYIYTLQRCIVVIKQHPKAIKGRYRAVIMWIAFICTVFHLIQFLSGLFTAVQISHGAWELVRSWLASMLALSMGIFFLPSKQMRMTSTSISGALHPKAKTGRAAETETEVEDQEEKEDGEAAPQKSADDEYDVDMESGFTGDVSADRAW